MILRRAATLVVLLLVNLPCQAAMSLADSLDACIDSRFTEGEASRINAEFNLAEACPPLFEHVLHNSSLQDFDPPLEDVSSLNQLLDVHYLLAQRGSHAETVYSIADSTYLQQLADNSSFATAPIELGLWERFIAWLKERYKDKEEAETDWGWLIDFLENGSIPKWLSDTIYYVAIGLIIVLAILIVVNELRAANLGKWRTRRRQRHGGSQWREGLATIDELSWDKIGKLPLQQQPGAMLRYVIDDLIERGWISDNRSRTNREMWRELRRGHRASAKRFDHAISLAERSVYGDESLESAQIRDLYETAHSIIEPRPGEPA